jgi:putative lipoprotein
MLEIDSGKTMYLLADYGEKKVTTPAPAPRDSADALVYEAKTESHRLTVVIRPTACQDSMSGEEMTHTVTVTLDGTEYRGCGRDLGGRG